MYPDYFRAVLALAHHAKHPAPTKVTNPVAKVLPSVPDHVAAVILIILVIITAVAWLVSGIRARLRRANGPAAY